VTSEAEFDFALQFGWGTVIEIDDRQPLVLKGRFPKEIHAGVTVRGYRKYTYQGPEIRTCLAAPGIDRPTSCDDVSRFAFCIAEDHVRFTGLRLRGARNDPRCGEWNHEFDKDRYHSQAIRVKPTDTMQIWIDHLDIGYWNGSAVDVRALSDFRDPAQCEEPPPKPLEEFCNPALEFPRKESVRAVANFIHHNYDYGVVTGTGAFVLDRANVFYGQKAHSVTSDGVRSSGYHAYDNLVLMTPRLTHDFDAHGSCQPGHWDGGLSGDYFDIGWNTVLSTGHLNFMQRGTPCRFAAIHNNVFLQSESAAIKTLSEDLSKHIVFENAFNATPDPLGDLAVADFDGDGIDDVFVGTGVAWYFSSGGQAEWRFLNRMPEHASSLRFGDFDGDGRADIIALHSGMFPLDGTKLFAQPGAQKEKRKPAHVDVSWGGMSPWETINVMAGEISYLAVGDFDGDRRADLFLATGRQWFYAPGGRNWKPLQFLRGITAELRFGDFRHAGRTEVLRVYNGQWQTAGLGRSWTNIGSAPTSSTAGLVVADFNGDGFDDVGHNRNSLFYSPWEYSSPGQTTGWTYLRNDSRLLAKQPVGRFDGNRTADVILWSGDGFDYAPSGRDPVRRISRQHMR
jgi:hypothetical protein